LGLVIRLRFLCLGAEYTNMPSPLGAMKKVNSQSHCAEDGNGPKEQASVEFPSVHAFECQADENRKKEADGFPDWRGAMEVE
jgi:hypothetical protein